MKHIKLPPLFYFKYLFYFYPFFVKISFVIFHFEKQCLKAGHVVLHIWKKRACLWIIYKKSVFVVWCMQTPNLPPWKSAKSKFIFRNDFDFFLFTHLLKLIREKGREKYLLNRFSYAFQLDFRVLWPSRWQTFLAWAHTSSCTYNHP